MIITKALEKVMKKFIRSVLLYLNIFSRDDNNLIFLHHVNYFRILLRLE